MKGTVEGSTAWKLSIMDWLKWVIFPGMNLHARERFVLLPASFGDGQERTRLLLDAGFGNGMLAWQAWRRGFRVVGVTLKDSEVKGAVRQFNKRQRIPESELCFIKHNLYDTDFLKHHYGHFDEIVCADVIEHIVDHQRICRAFWQLLKPGGFLHITTPNADHPYNAGFPLDLNEGGGHVRAGYTLSTFEELLLPIGFEVSGFVGFGGPVRQWFNRRIKETQERFGPWAGVPLFLFSLPCLALDGRKPVQPFSYYIRVRKPEASQT